ncbi:MAG TPA: aldo/keto reductase [Frankiaceae bacterium]|jgi:2,5-diketo-D-gluconate reductase A|nr:aldo/keto reductase [Frankiaceae bacterium]
MVPDITLHDGTTIPQLGFGTLQIPESRQPSEAEISEAASVISEALAAGYRHVDTAQSYGNETAVGRAVALSGVARDGVFITSKLSNANHRPDDVRRSFEETLAKLGSQYLDLFLIHWPLPTRYGGDYVSTWQALAELASEKRLRSVGVSNFQPAHLDRIVSETGVKPVVNQIEAHPYFPNAAAADACRAHGVAIEAWSPLGRGPLLQDGVIVGIANDCHKTPAQVVLRWHVQRRHVVVPKSVRPERMTENFAIFDFALTDGQMAAIGGLDKGEAGRVGPHPDAFDWIPSAETPNPR